MTAHFDRNISFVDFYTQNPLKMSISSLKNSDDLFWSSTTIRGIFVFFILFPNFPRNPPLFLPKSREKFSFHSSASDDFFSHRQQIGLPLIHQCKNNLSSLHISVHHCTFCASLHVKASPALTLI